MKRIVLLIIAVLILEMLPLSGIEASPNLTGIGLAWHAEYYDNQYLSGTPKIVREEGALNYNWGANHPVDGVPADYFTARWTTRPTLDAGLYRFTLIADDSVKLTVDYNNVVIDTMSTPKAGQVLSVDLNLTAGSHYFQVDYRELAGNASITATLERLDGQNKPGTGAPSLPATPSAYVNASSLRVRSGPGTEYTILSVKSQYTVVNLIGRNGDAAWVKVTLPDGSQGWMSAAYLVANVNLTTLPVATGEVPSVPQTPTQGQLSGVVTAYALNVRSGPSTDYTIIGRLVLFTPVQMIGRNEAATWVKIRRTNGELGWVSATYISMDGMITALPIVY